MCAPRYYGFGLASAMFALLLLWVAPAKAYGVPSKLEIFPSSLDLSGVEASHQLVVTAYLSDGSVRDVTRASQFSADSKVIEVTPTGVVLLRSNGVSRVRVSALGMESVVSVACHEANRPHRSSYRLEVAAILSKAGCNMGACHGNINGKGGFRLSLRGEDSSLDFLSLTHDAFGRRTNLNQPSESLILLKPTARLSHEGGTRFDSSSIEAHSILSWIEAGARDDITTTPRLLLLRVFPEHRINAFPSRTQQLSVVAEFSDHTKHDVTRLCAFDVNDPTKVSASPDGLVTSKTPVETAVAVRYLTGRAVSRIAFLADRPNFAGRTVPTDNLIDRYVFAKLNTLKIAPAEAATDAVFLRRSHLDAIGLPPTSEAARAFLQDADPAKRSKLVDRLVERPEFADFWALKWADVLRNEETSMGDKGVWMFQRWLRDQIAADIPLDEFARRIIAAKGSTYRNPPASFYRTNRDPQTAAETVGQVFLGVRLQCARCHNHPFDVWTQDDYYGLTAYFANVGRKILDPERRDKFDNHEINGDVIIHLAGRPQMVQPRSGQMMQPKPPGGPRPDLHNDPNALDDLADWLTINNPQFTRNMVNRVWFHLLGRGIVEPVDDFRDSNPPSNPELLDALTVEFRRNGMRLRPLVALIMKSRTYAFGSETNETNADDEANFSHAVIKLNTAEVLLDALSQALGKPDQFPQAPPMARATQLPGLQSGGTFLKTFGKPERLLTCECERSETTTLAQAFQLINGTAFRDKIEATDNRVGQLIRSKASDEVMADEMALAILNRHLTASETTEILGHVAKARDRRKAWEDAAWVLLNTKEFLLRH